MVSAARFESSSADGRTACLRHRQQLQQALLHLMVSAALQVRRSLCHNKLLEANCSCCSQSQSTAGTVLHLLGLAGGQVQRSSELLGQACLGRRLLPERAKSPVSTAHDLSSRMCLQPQLLPTCCVTPPLGTHPSAPAAAVGWCLLCVGCSTDPTPPMSLGMREALLDVEASLLGLGSGRAGCRIPIPGEAHELPLVLCAPAVASLTTSCCVCYSPHHKRCLHGHGRAPAQHRCSPGSGGHSVPPTGTAPLSQQGKLQLSVSAYLLLSSLLCLHWAGRTVLCHCAGHGVHGGPGA